MARRGPVALRASLLLLRAAAFLVPRRLRDAWLQEWDAEVRHRWQRLERRGQFGREAEFDVLRQAVGALPDAAWLRRQLTADADFLHDARHALRLLRRNAGFAATVVCVLGLAVGGSTAVFSLAEAVLWRPLPLTEPERVVTLWQTNAREGLDEDDVSPANFLDWRERVRSIRPLAAAVPSGYDLNEGAEPEVVLAMRVTEGFFEALGARAARGRLFRPEENEAGRHRVAVMSHALWKRFGGDPGLVGREIRLDGEPYTVVGVLPPDFVLGLLSARAERGLFTPSA
jgi:hypothetical protein